MYQVKGRIQLGSSGWMWLYAPLHVLVTLSPGLLVIFLFQKTDKLQIYFSKGKLPPYL